MSTQYKGNKLEVGKHAGERKYRILYTKQLSFAGSRTPIQLEGIR